MTQSLKLASELLTSQSDWATGDAEIHGWHRGVLLGFTLSETMFGEVLWVEEHPHEPEFPLEHCSVAAINTTHFICQGFNAVADWCYLLLFIILMFLGGKNKKLLSLFCTFRKRKS